MREDIEEVLNSNFLDILRDPRRDRLEDIEAITSEILTLVSFEQNQLLMNAITLQKVQEQVFQMKEGTSPGQDGFVIDDFATHGELHFYGLPCPSADSLDPMDHFFNFDVSKIIPKNMQKLPYATFKEFLAYIRGFDP